MRWGEKNCAGNTEKGNIHGGMLIMLIVYTCKHTHKYSACKLELEQLVPFQAKMPNILWFLLLFWCFSLCYIIVNILSLIFDCFWTK